jgi:hypothetical protein
LQLSGAPDERRLDRLRAPDAAHVGEDAQRAPDVDRLAAALDHVRAGVLEGQRLLGRLPGHVVDEHRAGRRERLDPGRRVDGVADDHSLADGVELDGRLAGEDARAHLQLVDADPRGQAGDRRTEVEARPHRALGVVLARERRTPERHHGVADELLDRPAIGADGPAGDLEVLRENLADLLRVAALAERGVADQVGEQHRHQAPLLGARRRRRRAGGRRRHGTQRLTALVAEARAGGGRGAAGGTGDRERGAAVVAEPRSCGDLGAAGRAALGHDGVPADRPGG